MNREEMLKDLRTNEATKNGLMGLEGKFALVVKRLGQPLIQQGSRMFNQTFLEDPYAEADVDDLPVMSEEESSYEVGLHFDGLTRGVNMTISIYHHLREIVCRYEGQIVYKEVAGELEGYAPSERWESHLENFFALAKKVDRRQRPEERKEMVAIATKKKSEVLEYLRKKWGL